MIKNKTLIKGFLITMILVTINSYFTTVNQVFAKGKTYSSKITLTAEATKMDYEIKQYNDKYIIKNDSYGPILVNNKYIVDGHEMKELALKNTPIISWYK